MASIDQITSALRSQLQRKSLLKGELSQIASKLRLMQDALLKVSEAISGQKPNARMLQQM
jgi:hypothetical protein